MFGYKLEKGKTITGENYVTLLDKLVTKIKKKPPHFKKQKILFTGTYFAEFVKLYYSKDIKILEDRWKECISLQRDIMLKNKNHFTCKN